MYRQDILDVIEMLQDKAEAMGFEKQYDYDIFLRELLTEYILNTFVI
jgi:hypothetical protein